MDAAWGLAPLDTAGMLWQTRQSIYAISTGGMFGVGIGASVQKHQWLPYAENDFIFGVIGEELGFFGCVILIGAFAVLLIMGVMIALRAPDLYGTVLGIGIISQIAWQVFLHIAVGTALIPNTGISLPFFSSGGTSLSAAERDGRAVEYLARRKCPGTAPGRAAPRRDRTDAAAHPLPQQSRAVRGDARRPRHGGHSLYLSSSWRSIMRVLIAAGGTAGHINPALAIAGALKAADPTAEIHFAGRREGMEYGLVTKAGTPSITLRSTASSAIRAWKTLAATSWPSGIWRCPARAPGNSERGQARPCHRLRRLRQRAHRARGSQTRHQDSHP